MSATTTQRPSRTRPRINPRIAERRAEVRRERMLRRRKRTLILAVIVLVGAGLSALERSALVALTDVEVTGTERLDPVAVREAAALPLGTSTLRLRLGEAEQRIEALALVADASVQRSDPLTVRIVVTERRPVAVVRTQGRPALVDGDGVVITHTAEDGLPVIVTSAAQPPPTGQTVAAVPALANAFAVYRGLPAPLRQRIVTYEAVSADDVVLVLGDGIRARVGRAERIDEKARALGALLDLGRPLREVDLRAPSNPVVVPGTPDGS